MERVDEEAADGASVTSSGSKTQKSGFAFDFSLCEQSKASLEIRVAALLKPTKEILQLRTEALAGKGERTPKLGAAKGLTPAAEFATWKVSLVTTFTSCSLEHLSYTLEVDGRCPFTSDTSVLNDAVEVVSALAEAEGGITRIMMDWEKVSAITQNRVCDVKHAAEIALVTKMYPQKPHERVRQLLLQLTLAYTPVGALAALDAFNECQLLASLPVKVGGMRSRIQEISACMQSYAIVHAGSDLAFELNVGLMVEIFRAKGLCNSCSSVELRTIAMPETDLWKEVESNEVAEFAAVLERLATADSALCAPCKSLGGAAAPTLLKGTCWSCEEEGHPYWKCPNAQAKAKFAKKYSAPPPQKKDSKFEAQVRDAVHKSKRAVTAPLASAVAEQSSEKAAKNAAAAASIVPKEDGSAAANDAAKKGLAAGLTPAKKWVEIWDEDLYQS